MSNPNLSVEQLISREHCWKVPASVDKNTVRDLLFWVGVNKINNLKIKSDYRLFIEKGRGFYPLDQRPLRYAEVREMYNGLKERESADTALKQGVVDDFQFYLPPTEDGSTYGFRVCATGCRPYSQSKDGMEMMLRVIPGAPPTLAWNKLQKPLEKALTTMGGLIIVGGSVNSGKTTLLGGVLRHLSTTTNFNGYTIEDPAEYDFGEIEDIIVPITQIEVGTNIKDFNEALRMLLRKSPHYAMYGESRDTESIRHMAIAAETGMTVYTTVHTNKAKEAIPRMIRDFPQEAQESMKNAFVAQTRCIVYQRLLSRPDRSLTAAREYVVLTDKDRVLLSKSPVSDIPDIIHDLQIKRKTDYISGLDYLLSIGEIDRNLYEIEKADWTK